MTPSCSCQEMYEQLIEINKEAFGQSLFEVAYHALAAALHCAIVLEGQTVLRDLEQRATEQRDWIEAYALGHPLSTQSALLHRHRSIYTSLVAQIKTRGLMQQQHPHL